MAPPHHARGYKRGGLLCLILFSLSVVSGCAGVGMIAGDVAGTVVDKTDEAWRAGKYLIFIAKPWRDVAAGQRRVADTLGLRFIREESHPDQIKLVYQDDRDQEIDLNAIRRNDRITEVRVDVGLFGPPGLGRLVMDAVLKELGEESSRVGTP